MRTLAIIIALLAFIALAVFFYKKNVPKDVMPDRIEASKTEDIDILEESVDEIQEPKG